MQVWFICCVDGLNKVPKCRYGENDCYFARTITDYTGLVTGTQFFNRGDSRLLALNGPHRPVFAAIEGDSDTSLEQLAIPFLVYITPLLLILRDRPLTMK